MLPSIELTVEGSLRKFVFYTRENFLWGFLTIQSKSMPKEMQRIYGLQDDDCGCWRGVFAYPSTGENGVFILKQHGRSTQNLDANNSAAQEYYLETTPQYQFLMRKENGKFEQMKLSGHAKLGPEQFSRTDFIEKFPIEDSSYHFKKSWVWAADVITEILFGKLNQVIGGPFTIEIQHVELQQGDSPDWQLTGSKPQIFLYKNVLQEFFSQG